MTLFFPSFIRLLFLLILNSVSHINLGCFEHVQQGHFQPRTSKFGPSFSLKLLKILCTSSSFPYIFQNISADYLGWAACHTADILCPRVIRLWRPLFRWFQCAITSLKQYISVCPWNEMENVSFTELCWNEHDFVSPSFLPVGPIGRAVS